MTNALVIFCDDLRIKDNPALASACQYHQNIIPLFIYDENYLGRKIGAAAKVFLHHILQSFNALLKKEYGCSLVLRAGNSFDEIKKILQEIKIDAIYFNQSYTKTQIEFEEKLSKKFLHLQVKSFKAKILFEPHQIKTGKGEPFKVFTPFSKECLKNISLIGNVFKQPKILPSKHNLKSLAIDDLKLLPKNEGRWHHNLSAFWQFNYEKISKDLFSFIDKKLDKYQESRNNAGVLGTSRISPYLRFGVISVRALFYEVERHKDHQQFLLEILWREFAYHVNFYNPNIATKEIKENYSAFKWEDAKEDLQLWQKAKTGFEIVDAGMRELWASGFMHNRVRMIVASFLIKDLFVDWKKGEEWFWNCLVDADMAVNPFSWQWVFGSGLDAAPYFRIFNPILQQQRFDPNKIYCKKWLPKNYNIKEIVDHDVRRKVALEKYKEVKAS